MAAHRRPESAEASSPISASVALRASSVLVLILSLVDRCAATSRHRLRRRDEEGAFPTRSLRPRRLFARVFGTRRSMPAKWRLWRRGASRPSASRARARRIRRETRPSCAAPTERLCFVSLDMWPEAASPGKKGRVADKKSPVDRVEGVCVCREREKERDRETLPPRGRTAC